MELAIVTVILISAAFRLHRAYREAKMASEFVAVGALVGSIIAARIRKSTRWIFQTAVGAYLGYVAAPWLIDYAKWPLTSDYYLLAGTLTGCISYSIVETILSPEIRKAAKGAVITLIGKVGLGPGRVQ